jgi:hypothetical protein
MHTEVARRTAAPSGLRPLELAQRRRRAGAQAHNHRRRLPPDRDQARRRRPSRRRTTRLDDDDDPAGRLQYALAIAYSCMLAWARKAISIYLAR